MNHSLQQLYQIAQKDKRQIIGLMSGTSMDGLDVALCEVSGAGNDTEVRLRHFKTVDYTPAIKAEIRKVFAKETINFPHLAMLNPWIGNLHADMILSCLKEWQIAPQAIDLIASHGQTVMHTPKILHKQAQFPNATLQIGDGDHIAVRTGIITISDFRQKHCAAGGEGAPLAVYGDYFILGKKGEDRILLNMGGIANFTYLPASMDANAVFVTDTGPGNTLLDAFTQHFFPEKSFDKNAAIARQGQVNESLLAELKRNDFFQKPFPKTTGPELFSKQYVQQAQAESKTEGISVHDLMATLTRFSAETIAEAILWEEGKKETGDGRQENEFSIDNFQFSMTNSPIPNSPIPNSQFPNSALETRNSKLKTIYCSGGGMHNPLLMEFLQELLPNYTFKRTDDLGINGDAKEAVLFALLANETVAGGQTSFGTREGVPSVAMGKISFPR